MTSEYEFRNSRGFFGAVIGTVIAYAGQSAPNGWLICNGGSYSTTEYADLFSVIGNRYGGGGASFNVPDLRNQFIRGSSNTSSLNDTTSGANTRTHTLTKKQMPAHSHTYSDAYFAEGIHGGVNNMTGQSWTDSNNGFWWRGTSIQTSAIGSGTAFEYDTIPPYLAMNYIIKY